MTDLPDGAPLSLDEPVDLTNCEREPIHIPGSVQPHGFLLVVDPDDRRVLQATRNVRAHLGVEVEALLGRPLHEVLGVEEDAASAITDETRRYAEPFDLPLGPEGRSYALIPHHTAGGVVVEGEPAGADAEASGRRFYRALRTATLRLQQAPTVEALCDAIADEVRALTGLDRVMVYRFDEHWNGEVIAEAKRDGIGSFLDLHFPASDIPAQARRLYTLNWVRHIADVDYRPSPLEPQRNPRTGAPLDMSHAYLRSVSPIHIEYLKNMGVAATMSISLLKDGRLWGLIACHHYEARTVPYAVQAACEFLGQVFSMQLAGTTDSAAFGRQLASRAALTRCVGAVTGADDLASGLAACGDALLALTGASGACARVEGDLVLVGETPDAAQVEQIATWLGEEVEDTLFATDSLAGRFAPAGAFGHRASGLLAAALSRAEGSYLLWFRPEVVRDVTWGGNPEKPVELVGEGRLRPRASFEAWTEQLRDHSLPWQPFEIEAAGELRGALLDLALRRAEALARSNLELERSNAELDAFAYVASHDLKEPLRGIHNFATFLKEDYETQLDEEGVHKLDTLVRLTQRMETLINSLLHFSRVGRTELVPEPIDLRAVVEEVRESLVSRLAERDAEIVLGPVAPLHGDPVRVREAIQNLIDNALKYNDKERARVEIGTLDLDAPESATTTVYVRDNGIGIPERHRAGVFQIFKRLHARDAYGGGTGVGLAIVDKIVTRHGGRIWLESTPGEGTTFFFTLTPDEDGEATP